MRAILLPLLLFALPPLNPVEISAEETASKEPVPSESAWLKHLSDALVNKGVMSGNPGVVSANGNLKIAVGSISEALLIPSEVAWMAQGIPSLAWIFGDGGDRGDADGDDSRVTAALILMRNLTVWDSYTEMGKPNT